MYVDVSAMGTVSDVQRPVADRYSPTDVGLTSRLDVPIATHELSVVHATVDSGTEMLTAGRPVTCGLIAGVDGGARRQQHCGDGAHRHDSYQ